MVLIWNTYCKERILLARDIKSMLLFFLIVIVSDSRFFLLVINHYYFGGSLQWFCLQIGCDTKYFSSLVKGIVIED